MLIGGNVLCVVVDSNVAGSVLCFFQAGNDSTTEIEEGEMDRDEVDWPGLAIFAVSGSLLMVESGSGGWLSRRLFSNSFILKTGTDKVGLGLGFFFKGDRSRGWLSLTAVVPLWLLLSSEPAYSRPKISE